MAHFAKLDDNNYVLEVHVVNNEVITRDGVESEQLGIDFLTSLHSHSNWKQTSYNSTFRKNYAGIGYFYDEIRDAFISPKPERTENLRSEPIIWELDEDTCLWIEVVVPS
jgi:hypothetical protein